MESKVELWVERWTLKLKSRVRAPLLPMFFFVFSHNLPHLQKAEDFFGKKKYYINYRYDRQYAEDLRPPRFWQMDSIYVSLGWRGRFFLLTVAGLTQL